MKTVRKFATYIAVASVALFVWKSIHTEPPPGFKLRYNELGRWTWVDSAGYQSMFTSRTRFGAVKDAWSWHRYKLEKEQRNAWRDE